MQNLDRATVIENLNDARLQVLIECGFTIYEARVLSVLGIHKQLTANEVAAYSQVPVNKVYQCLKKLVADEFVELAPTKPKKFRAPRIRDVVAERLEAKARRLQKTSNQLSEFFTPQESEIDQPKRDIWLTQGKRSMVKEIVNILAAVRKESLAFIDVWTAQPDNLQAISHAISRGVKFKFLGDTSTIAAKKIVKKYRAIGVEIRHAEVRGAGYSIFDGRRIQIRISSGGVTAIWAESPALGKILREHFYASWNKAGQIM